MNSFRIGSNFLSTQFKHATAYPLNFFFIIFEWFFVSLINLFIWYSIIQTNPSLGFDQSSITRYYLLIPLIGLLTSAWHGRFLGRNIRLGRINARLLQPVHPLVYTITSNLAQKVLQIFFLFPLVVLMGSIYDLHISLAGWSLLFFVASILLGAYLDFVLQTLIGFTAFWWSDVGALDNINRMLSITLGGWTVPLFFFPESIRFVAVFLPFRYLASFPLEILNQTISYSEILQGFTILISWSVVVGVLGLVMWHKGLAKYSAYGG